MPQETIYEHLKKYRDQGLSSFHTPGHKCSGFFPQDLLSLDLTALPDTDALYEANGIILDTEKQLARLFGAERTLISAGGCTLAIQTMLRIASKRGGKILFARSLHRSAVNTAALLGIVPVWICPHSDNGFFTGRVTPEDIELALKNDSGITACYITSPDYYGEISDIAGIAEVCHRHGVLLLVDNAHGSHLRFMKKDRHPITLGADMSACSLHKTLPVLTGGSVLNIADSELAEGAKEDMALFGSTSPSYPIMASIGLCLEYLTNGGIEEYRRLEDRIGSIRELAAENGLVVPGGECDPLRVCFNTSCAGLEGEAQTDYFHSFGIEPEFCDGKTAVFICTPFNKEEDFIRLENSIKNLRGSGIAVPPVNTVLPEAVFTPREALMRPCESVPVDKAEGRICGEIACPCPPGIPVVMPGEIINKDVIAAVRASYPEGTGIKCVK